MGKAVKKIERGSFVRYRVRKMTIHAIVRACHRDGSVTVEARHVLKRGEPFGCYLGYLYRMDRADLRAAA